MNKIRIAFFLDVMEEDFDGVSITMHQIIKRIPRDRFDAIFITPHPPKNDIGFEVITCPYIRVPEKNKEYRFGLPGRLKGLNKKLDQFSPNIIHYSSPTLMGRYAVKYAKSRDIKVSTIYHTHYHSFISYYSKGFKPLAVFGNAFVNSFYQVYKKTDKVLAPTPAMYKYLIEFGISKESLAIWGRGVDMHRFNPEKRNLSIWDENISSKKKVLFVSRLVREKEPMTLVRIYQLLERSRNDVAMIVVGDGPMRAKLEENMPNAYFMGRQYGSALSEIYASSDVFLFPSTTETFGNVVLEALASGLPVVAANAGGPSDIVRNEETGFLVAPGNEAEFAARILQIIDNPELSLKMSQAAYDYACSQSWEKLSTALFDEYLDLYHHVN